MPRATEEETDRLGAFEHGFSRAGLLLRYARGRRGHFASRQIITGIVGLMLLLIHGPGVAGLAVALVLTGEVADCLFLERVPGWLNQGAPFRRLYLASTVTAGFQAATVSVCAWLAWHWEPGHAASLFPIALLMAAAINAALAMPYHPAATITRLAIYGAVVLAGFAAPALAGAPLDPVYAMNAAGALILAYVVIAFVGFVSSGYMRTLRQTEALVRQSRELTRTNARLTARQKEAQQLSLVARNANDSVILADRMGRIFWTNDAFTRITGFSREEVIGRRPGDFLNGPETNPETDAAIIRAVAEGRPFRGEIQNVAKDGRDIWMEINLVPVIGDDGEIDVVVSIERDMTAARRHARELEQARLAAEEGARAKADFLATMSHEIRTPMNGIVGMADLLCETPLSSEQMGFAETIRSSAQALLTIINDVLDLSKLDAQKVVLNPVDFDLQSCLKETVKLLCPQAREKGLMLDLDLMEDLPARVRADDGRLRQVLINLIGNGLKFTRTGGVTVRADAVATRTGHRLTIMVEDTGIGIAEDKLAYVFERFSQAESTTTRRFGGTGLGLTISHMLIKAMGGEISVRSQVGAGSCFTVTLDVAAARPVGNGGAALTGDPGPGPDRGAATDLLAGRRVLVAEDNRVNRMLIDKFLAPTGVDYYFAHDGRQAVILNRTEKPDLIFMDMSMPVMNGLDATREIRASGDWQPRIVALTANAFASDREACLGAGMDGFLTKPVRKDDLLTCLARHLAPTPQTKSHHPENGPDPPT